MASCSQEKVVPPNVVSPTGVEGLCTASVLEYLSMGSLKLPDEAIGDGQTILPSLAGLLHIETQGIDVAA
jgi:hypothetical protein